MNEKELYKLRADPDFTRLSCPISEKEFQLLADSICSSGCKIPISIWDDIILDGHKRYQICCDNNIPFDVKRLYFAVREDAVIWACRQHCQHVDLSDERRKYLIGAQYNAAVSVLLASKHSAGPKSDNLGNSRSRTMVARNMGEEYHTAWNTIRKYGIYANALDTIKEKAPDFAQRILSGQYKVSHENIEELASLKPRQMERVMDRLELMQPFGKYKSSRRGIQTCLEESHEPLSVKDMPTTDPDAEIKALTLTIPSWIGSIERVQRSHNLLIASEIARYDLAHALADLRSSIYQLSETLGDV